MFGWGKPAEVPIYPELESPESTEAINALIEKKMTFLNELLNDNGPGWSEVAYNVEGHKDVKIVSKPMPGESVNVVKANGIVDASPQKVISMYHGDLANRQKVEVDLIEFKVLKEIDQNTHIEYSAFKSPSFPVSDREFTYIRHEKVNFDGKGSNLILMISINYKDQPVVDKRVRGALVITGLVMKAVEGDANKCHFHRVVQLDPKGSIPAFVVNAVAKKAGDVIVNLKKSVV